MKTPALRLNRNGLALAATLALVLGCDANHVLGVVDAGPNIQNPGSAGTSDMSPDSTGQAGTRATGAAGAIADGAAATGVTTDADGTAGTGVTTDAGGAAGAKADAGTVGPGESWTGYVENRTFASGSDTLTLKFAADADGVVSGTIVFGMGTPPPPATDPNVGYPPNLVSSSPLPPGPGLATRYVAEGFPYAFYGGSLATGRLRFSANLWQLWAGWCALQTPASDGSGGCLPNWGGMSAGPPRNMCSQTNPQTMEVVPVDCGKLFLCFGGFGPCSCPASGCGLSQQTDPAVFDIFITADTASGSAELPFFGTNNVHFVKN
jgi:hypothetical protein